MGMREKRENFEKWWGRRVEEISGPVNVSDVEAAWQAAALQAAERMKEEAAKVCESDESGRDANGYYANEIRAIDVNKLFGES